MMPIIPVIMHLTRAFCRTAYSLRHPPLLIRLSSHSFFFLDLFFFFVLATGTATFLRLTDCSPPPPLRIGHSARALDLLT